MENTITVEPQRFPLPYVPELPAEFVRMIQSCGGQTARQAESTPEPVRD